MNEWGVPSSLLSKSLIDSLNLKLVYYEVRSFCSLWAVRTCSRRWWHWFRAVGPAQSWDSHWQACQWSRWPTRPWLPAPGLPQPVPSSATAWWVHMSESCLFFLLFITNSSKVSYLCKNCPMIGLCGVVSEIRRMCTGGVSVQEHEEHQLEAADVEHGFGH